MASQQSIEIAKLRKLRSEGNVTPQAKNRVKRDVKKAKKTVMKNLKKF